MGRISSPDCQGSRRDSFLLAASLCQASSLKLAGLGLVEAKRRLPRGGGADIHRMGGNAMAVDGGVVAGHGGGQRLNKGATIPGGGLQVKGGDGPVAVHRLRDEVGQHAGVPVAEHGLGDAHPATGGTGWPRHGNSRGGDGVVEGLAVGKGGRVGSMGSAAAVTQLVEKGRSDKAIQGTSYMHRKVHRTGVSWAGRGGLLGMKGSKKGLGEGGSY